MMEKRTVLDQVVLCADGSTQLKFLKQVVDDDGTVIASIPHRVVAAAKEDPEKVMAFAAERLGAKHAPVSQADYDWIVAAKQAKRMR